MYGDVVRYVETCHNCQISKIDRRARMGEPRALPIPEAPWDMVHMDWITGFPESPEGFDAILVFICALIGMVHLQACKKIETAKDTANHLTCCFLLLLCVYVRLQIHCGSHSAQGPRFRATLLLRTTHVRF